MAHRFGKPTIRVFQKLNFIDSWNNLFSAQQENCKRRKANYGWSLWNLFLFLPKRSVEFCMCFGWFCLGARDRGLIGECLQLGNQCRQNFWLLTPPINQAPSWNRMMRGVFLADPQWLVFQHATGTTIPWDKKERVVLSYMDCSCLSFWYFCYSCWVTSLISKKWWVTW